MTAVLTELGSNTYIDTHSLCLYEVRATIPEGNNANVCYNKLNSLPNQTGGSYF